MGSATVEVTQKFKGMPGRYGECVAERSILDQDVHVGRCTVTRNCTRYATLPIASCRAVRLLCASGIIRKDNMSNIIKGLQKIVAYRARPITCTFLPFFPPTLASPPWFIASSRVASVLSVRTYPDS